jgi:tRNA(Leu) C34 or U34 (ribose-2'-O)-methylase TrmL
MAGNSIDFSKGHVRKPIIQLPTDFSLRTRVCLMAAHIYANMEISTEQAAKRALELENAVTLVCFEARREGRYKDEE